MQKNTKKLGFSLIEMAVVLVIIGILAGAALSILGSSVDTAKFSATKDKMTEIMNSLHRFYAANGRLPCPAQLTKKLGDVASGATGDVAYGEEIYLTAGIGKCDVDPTTGTPANSTVPAGTYKIGSAGTYVYKGALPIRALSLPDTMMYDEYGSKFTYIVTEKFTTSAVNGVITVDDGIVPTTISSTVAVAVISHGKDRKGGYTSGTTIGIACNTAGKDMANCNQGTVANTVAGTVTLTDTQYNDLAAANWFDDIIKWEDKNKVIGLTSAATGTLSIKFTIATHDGNLVGVAGGNTLCNAEYSGYHICNKTTDITAYSATGSLPSALNYYANTGWIDGETNSCTTWGGTGGSGNLLSISSNAWITSTTALCNTTQAIACCKLN